MICILNELALVTDSYKDCVFGTYKVKFGAGLQNRFV